jgi:D-3-phosphoglycerate dehydrogenase
LNGLVGVVLGRRAPLAVVVGLLLQSLLMQHGGLDSLGVNACVIGLPAVAAGMLFPLLRRLGVPAFPLGCLLGAGTVAATAGLNFLVLLLGGKEDWETVAKLVLLAHVPVMIVEGLMLGVIVQYLDKVRPEMLRRSAAAVGDPHSAITSGMSELPLVLVTEGSAASPLAWLRERARVVEAAPGSPAFDAALPDAAGMVVRTYTRVNAALLARCPKLKVVGRAGVGLENIDVAACRARGVDVVYTPDANTRAVGDFVIGFALQLLRPWAVFRDRAYEPGEFKRVRDTLGGTQLDELTVGILGMGRVGRRVGHVAANGFGARVIYHDLLDVRPHLTFPAAAVDKPTLFREADVVTLHVDMRPGNEHLVGAPLLALMKPTAILVNTSRGEVLDAAALAVSIREKKIAGAAIDVFDPEPPPADYPLLGLDNVLLTPHMAARTRTAVENMCWVVRDVVDALNGRTPTCPAP